MIINKKLNWLNKIAQYLLIFVVWYFVVMISIFLVIKMAGSFIDPVFLFSKQAITLIDNLSFIDLVFHLGYFHTIIFSITAIVALVTFDEINE